MKRETSQKFRFQLAGKTKTKLIVLYVSMAIILAGLIGTGVFLFFNLGNSEISYAAGSTYSSSGTGNWTANSTWIGGVAPPTNINGDDITINSNHAVTSGSLDVQNNAIFTISSNGTLTITGNLIV